MWTQGYRYNWVFLASVLCCTVVLFPFHTLPLMGHCSLLKHHSFWLSRPSLHSSVMFSNDDCVQLTTNYCFSCSKRVIDTLNFFRFVSHICTLQKCHVSWNSQIFALHRELNCSHWLVFPHLREELVSMEDGTYWEFQCWWQWVDCMYAYSIYSITFFFCHLLYMFNKLRKSWTISSSTTLLPFASWFYYLKCESGLDFHDSLLTWFWRSNPFHTFFFTSISASCNLFWDPKNIYLQTVRN